MYVVLLFLSGEVEISTTGMSSLAGYLRYTKLKSINQSINQSINLLYGDGLYSEFIVIRLLWYL